MEKPYCKYSDIELYAALSDKKNVAEAAFAELYSRFSQRVYAYCLRVMGDPLDAQDIFQEAFMKLFNSAHTRKDVDNLPGYLIAIARNLCINYKRRHKKTYNIEDYTVSTNDRGYEQKELMQLIGTALELLEFEYREAFVLRQYQGMSYKEISSVTGDSISAIKNRVWRAKERIKGILEPYLEDLSKT